MARPRAGRAGAADVTAEVEALQARLPGQVARMREALLGGLPQVQPGDHCHAPYECPFLQRCERARDTASGDGRPALARLIPANRHLG